MEALFGNYIQPACKYCSENYSDADDSTVMCIRRGIVSPDFKCRHFYYDPLNRVPKHPLELEKFAPEDFALE